MRITIGSVVDGKIVVSGEPLPEGQTVGVFVPSADASEPHMLTPTQAEELDRAIADVHADQVVDGDEHLARLRDKR